MDSKYVAMALFGLVAYQAGADPEGTQQGIGSFFTSTNGVVKQVPALWNGGTPSGGATAPGGTQPGPGYMTVNLPDGRTVSIPQGYRVVSTGQPGS